MKNSRGITLIALIITIIVMIILVGVTINVAVNSGLFGKSSEAAKEAEKHSILEQMISAMVLDDNGNINVKETYDAIEEMLGEQGMTITAVNPSEVTSSTTSVILEVQGKRGTYTYSITSNGIEIVEKGITVSISPSSITVGGTATLSVTKTGISTETSVTYTSSDTSVATVSGTTVAGVAEGTTTCTEGGKTYTATCTVTVRTAGQNPWLGYGLTTEDIEFYTEGDTKGVYYADVSPFDTSEDMIIIFGDDGSLYATGWGYMDSETVEAIMGSMMTISETNTLTVTPAQEMVIGFTMNTQNNNKRITVTYNGTPIGNLPLVTNQTQAYEIIAEAYSEYFRVRDVNITNHTVTIAGLTDEGITDVVTNNTITIPDSITLNYAGTNTNFYVTKIGKNAFYKLSGTDIDEDTTASDLITSIVFNNVTHLTEIDIAAFSYLTNVSNSITLPNSITTIGGSAFYQVGKNAVNGISISMPQSITTIGASAFHESGITSLEFTGTQLTELGSGTFADCTKLSYVKIPSSVTSIDEAFNNCTSLTTIDFSNASGLLTIEDNAFSNLPLASLDLSGATSLTTIKSSAFYSSTDFATSENMVTIAIPSTVTQIGDNAFGKVSVGLYDNDYLKLDIRGNSTLISYYNAHTGDSHFWGVPRSNIITQ